MIPRTPWGYAIDLASGMRKARSEGTDIATLTRRAGKLSVPGADRPWPYETSRLVGGGKERLAGNEILRPPTRSRTAAYRVDPGPRGW